MPSGHARVCDTPQPGCPHLLPLPPLHRAYTVGPISRVFRLCCRRNIHLLRGAISLTCMTLLTDVFLGVSALGTTLGFAYRGALLLYSGMTTSQPTLHYKVHMPQVFLLRLAGENGDVPMRALLHLLQSSTWLPSCCTDCSAGAAGQVVAGQVPAGQVMLPACVCRHFCTLQVLQHWHCAGNCNSHKAQQGCIQYSLAPLIRCGWLYCSNC